MTSSNGGNNMVDNKEQKSIEHIKRVTEQNINHIVRTQEDIKGIVAIEARTDGSFDVTIHDGTEDKAITIESVDKSKLLNLMKEQL